MQKKYENVKGPKIIMWLNCFIITGNESLSSISILNKKIVQKNVKVFSASLKNQLHSGGVTVIGLNFWKTKTIFNLFKATHLHLVQNISKLYTKKEKIT